MSVREKVRSHDERNGENTKMPLRVICKLVSTGLYCACRPADIVPLWWRSCASQFLYCAWEELHFKVGISRSASIPPHPFPLSTALRSVCSVRTYAIRNLILEPQRFALILLFFV